MPFIVGLNRPFEYQESVHDADARTKVIACGRQWGKNETSVHALTRGHGPGWREGKPKYPGLLQAGEYAWVAYNYKQAAKSWRLLKTVTRQLWMDGKLGRKNDQEKRLEIDTPNGLGALTIYSGDAPDTIRGETWDGVVIDEAGYQDLEYLLSQVVRPALGVKHGWLMLIGTPNGFNYFNHLYEKAPKGAKWQRPSFDNPLFTKDERVEILSDLGLTEATCDDDPRYRQEYLGHFVSAGTNVFHREWWSWLPFLSYPRHFPGGVYQSWDTAYGKGEEGAYSVCVTAGVGHDRIYVLDVWRGQVEFPDLKDKARSLAGVWNPRLVLIEDRASGQSLIQELKRKSDLPIYAVRADTDKRSRAIAAAPVVRDGLVVLPGQKTEGISRPEYGAPWVSDFVSEMEKFPLGRFVDQVDAFAHLLNYLRFIPTPAAQRPQLPELLGGIASDPLASDDEDSDSEYVRAHGDIFPTEAYPI